MTRVRYNQLNPYPVTASYAPSYLLTSSYVIDSASFDYRINNITTPSDVANTAVAATGINLNVTYNNGTGGIGATLTANYTASLFFSQSATLHNGDSLLVMSQSVDLQNGLYIVTNSGSINEPFVLTRSTLADETDELDSQIVLISSGSFSGRQYAQLTESPIVGTSSLIYVNITNTNRGLFQTMNGTQIKNQIPYYTNTAKQVTRGTSSFTFDPTKNSLNVTRITSSLYGTASYAITASYALNTIDGITANFPLSVDNSNPKIPNLNITGSLIYSSIHSLPGSALNTYGGYNFIIDNTSSLALPGLSGNFIIGYYNPFKLFKVTSLDSHLWENVIIGKDNLGNLKLDGTNLYNNPEFNTIIGNYNLYNAVGIRDGNTIIGNYNVAAITGSMTQNTVIGYYNWNCPEEISSNYNTIIGSYNKNISSASINFNVMIGYLCDVTLEESEVSGSIILGNNSIGYSNTFVAGGDADVYKIENVYFGRGVWATDIADVTIHGSNSRTAGIEGSSLILTGGDAVGDASIPGDLILKGGSGSAYEGIVEVQTLFRLKPMHPLPTPGNDCVFAISSSIPPKPYFYDGISWNSLY